ncbi:MAG: trypsin-like peptidase domain-containing protein [Planctomycetota bacterium]
MSESRLLRALPAALLLAAAVASLWTVPALIRIAQVARTARSMDVAADRLASSNALEAMSASMRDVAAAVEPAVVHISVAGEAKGRLGARSFTQSGSGWIWDAGGNIVTNAHVVDGATALEVQLHDGSLHPATLVGLDPRTDIAVLHIRADGLLPATRTPTVPAQGDLVFAFGSPFEFRFSMSSGIVSGVGRSAGIAEVEYESFIQVDAAVNPGNSGGPLTDVRGRVIGINTAIATGRGSSVGSGQFAGIGLAIPMSIAENVVTQLIDRGSVTRGFLGVSVVNAERVKAMSSQNPIFRAVAEGFKGDGAVITSITPGSPAFNAGLKLGDVIVALGDRRIDSRDEVLSEVGTKRPGAELPVEVWRAKANGTEGERIEMRVILATMDPSVNVGMFLEVFQRAGLSELADGSRDGRPGVQVGASQGPIAADIPVGSLIVALEGQRVASVDDLWVRLARSTVAHTRLATMPAANMTVLRPDGTERDVEVPLR